MNPSSLDLQDDPSSLDYDPSSLDSHYDGLRNGRLNQISE